MADKQNLKEHKFWGTQPVPQNDGEISSLEVTAAGPIDPEKDAVKDIRADPLALPAGFEWSTMDIHDAPQLLEIYNLLYNNYVEDDDAMFRFDYSQPFLKWALTPPGYVQEWHIGVRATQSKLLVGFISAIPAHTRVYDKTSPMVEINFLCVHKKLRSKRLAPVLIKEVTRRVNRRDIWQAVYTAGVEIPQPISSATYWHRSLNPKMLIDIGFSHLRPKWTMQMTVKFYALPDKPKTPGLRQMVEADVPQVCQLVTTMLKKYPLVVEFNEEEIKHWLFPVKDVVETWVVEDPKTKKLTDVLSFYALPSSIIGHPKYKTLKAAYSYYNVSTKTDMKELMNDALIIAKSQGFDVFNALDIMDNSEFLKDLKFGIGDGKLHYYLFNWRAKKMDPSGVGIVLL